MSYKPFSGKIVKQMPLLNSQRRTLVSVADVLDRRVSCPDEFVRNNWRANYFDTGDMVLYHPHGKIKIVLDAQIALTVGPSSELVKGALVLPKGYYESVKGLELRLDDILAGVKLGKDEALKSKVWEYVARGQGPLTEYVNELYSVRKGNFNSRENMAIYFGDFEAVPVGRLLRISSWGVGSYLSGSYYLNVKNSLLVGKTKDTVLEKIGALVGMVTGDYNHRESPEDKHKRLVL